MFRAASFQTHFTSAPFLFFAALFFAAPVVWAEQVVIVATVNIENAKIVSQEGGVFKLAFDLSNQEGMQAGVKYGVQLVSQTATTQVLADEKVYDETLMLPEHSTLHRDITYMAPPSLSGTYTLHLISKNESGFPLAEVSLGMITITKNVVGLAILPESCFLQVVNEKGTPHYTLLQGVDITSDETLRLTCVAQNSATTALFATPSFETRYRSAYGATVSTEGGDTAAISFKQSEKKTFSVVLPKAKSPQSYEVEVTLETNGVRSNAVSVHYVLQGESATIHGVSPDKDFYQKGDTAIITFLWSPSAGDFLGARKGANAPSATNFQITLTNSEGKDCADLFKGKLDTESIKQEARVPILSDCKNPQIAFSLTDAQGTLFDHKEAQFTSTSGATAWRTKIFLLLLALLAIIVGGRHIMKNKKGGTLLRAFIPFLFLILAGGMTPLDRAHASTACINSGGTQYCSTINGNSQSYNPGGGIYFSFGTWNSSTCGNPLSQQPPTTFFVDPGPTEGSRIINFKSNPTSGITGVPVSIPITVSSVIPPDKPSVDTLPATSVTGTTATLNGTADPHGKASTGWFRYYQAPPASCVDSGGVRSPASGGTALGSGTSYTPYSSGIASLTQGTTYYYCAFASNVSGTGAGGVQAFVAPGNLPTISTLPATAIGGGSATLNGSANPNGSPTFGWFRWSPTSPNFCTDSFGSTAPVLGSFGSGTNFTGAVNNTGWSAQQSLVIGDVNKDGKNDLITTGMNTSAAQIVSVYMGNGNGTFLPKVDYIVGVVGNGMPSPGSIVLSDVSQDSWPDIVVATYNNSYWNGGATKDNASVLINNGNGTFAINPYAVYPVDNVVAKSNFTLALAEVGNPGRADIVINQQATGQISDMSNKGSGPADSGYHQFDPPNTWSSGAGVMMASGDFNADGKVDIAGATGGSTGVRVFINQGFIGNNTGTFPTYVDYVIKGPDPAVNLSPNSVAVGDLNGDGKPDIVAGAVDYASSVSGIAVLLNSGIGTFATSAFYPLTIGENCGSGNCNLSVAIGDVNGDGKKDIVIATADNGFSAFFNNGSGVFGAAVSSAIAPGSNPVLYLVAGDLNGDSKADVAALTIDAPSYTYMNTIPGTPAMAGLGAGSSAIPYSFDIAGLLSGTTYYYCAIASNAWGVALGNLMSFVYGSAPTVTATINGTPTANIPSGDPFILNMTSTGASSCTWSQTTDGAANFTNAAIPSAQGGPTSYNNTFTSGFTKTHAWEWTFTCSNGFGSASSVARLFMDDTSVSSAANQVPVANAGPDQTVALPTNSVTVNGSGSSDPDGSIVSYAWNKVSGPAGDTIVSPGSASTDITGLVVGTYVYILTVTDNSGASAADDVVITVTNISTFTITATAGANGTISPSGAVTVNSGNTQAFTVTPNAGYSIGSVSGCDGSLSGNTYTTAPITSDCPVTATFTVNSYTYTFNGNGATVNPSPTSVTQSYGSAIAAPTNPSRTGYSFTGWSPALPATMPLGGGSSNAQWSLLTGCANGKDASGNTLELISDATAEINRRTVSGHEYTVTKWGSPYYCFGNTGSTEYYIPIGTKPEMDFFYNAIPRLTGLYVIP